MRPRLQALTARLPPCGRLDLGRQIRRFSGACWRTVTLASIDLRRTSASTLGGLAAVAQASTA